MTRAIPSLSLIFVCLGSWGCSDQGGSSTSDDGVDTQNDGSVDDASTPPEKAELPSAFGDCSQEPCEVTLSAFTSCGENCLPDCPLTQPTEEETATACDSFHAVGETSCESLTGLRFTYAWTGDFFDCYYDSSRALVGARWAPDNHQTQIAGQQMVDDSDSSCSQILACPTDEGNALGGATNR